MAELKFKKVKFDPGDYLFTQGEIGTSFFIIESGTVEITITILEKDSVLKIATVGPGEILGELSVITKTPRNATAHALSSVKAIKISEKDYQTLADDLPDWAKALIKSLAVRIQNTDAQFSLEHANTMRTAREHERMGKELKVAHIVQNTLFPTQPEFKYDGFQVAGFYQSAYECCGDWWYHTEIGDKVFIWIGDATGHGVSAALVVSAARAVAAILEYDKEMTPAKGLKILNHAIFHTSKGKVSMTFFLGCYDKKTGVFSYSNASHESPYLFRKIDKKYFLEQHMILDKINSPRLGEGLEREFKETSIKLEKGDYILAYTDGVTSLTGPNKLEWGERRMLNTFFKSIQGSPSASEVSKFIIQQMATFRKLENLEDDVTFVVLHLP